MPTITQGEKIRTFIQNNNNNNNNNNDNMCLQIYQFPDCDSDEDEEFKQQDRELKACVPFAVVGSNTVIEVAGKKVRGRQYPWGVVEGEFYLKFYCVPNRKA
jgi:septin family protein